MKILIIKPSSFGDIIQANPALSALKDTYPESSIHWLFFEQWKDIAGLFPDLSGSILWKRTDGISGFAAVVKNIRREKFDLVIDLQGLARTAIIAFLSGAKTKIGVPGLKEGAGLLIREAYPESSMINAVERNIETVRALTGKKFTPEFRISITDAAKKSAELMLEKAGINPLERPIALIPGVRGRSKQWPVSYFRQLQQMLSSAGFKTVALGSSGDYSSMEGLTSVVNLCGKTSIPELAAVLARCSAAAGCDTGPVHLAAGIGIPVVTIFGGSDIKETAPYTAKSSLLTRNMQCSPCRTRPSCIDFPCLTGIKPAEVFKAINKLI